MIKKTLYHTLRCHARLSIYRHFFWERNAAKTPRPNFQNVIYKLLSSMPLFLNLQKSSWYFCCYFYWFEYGLYVQVRQDSFLSVYSCIVERDENQWKSPNDLCCRRHTNHKKWLQMTIKLTICIPRQCKHSGSSIGPGVWRTTPGPGRVAWPVLSEPPAPRS